MLNRRSALRTYSNPVIDHDFPDPFVVAADDAFFALSTQSQYDGSWVNVPAARSSDLVRWKHLGDALPVKPRWARTTQKFMAPDVRRHGDRYLLYFAALPDDGGGMCLGTAISDRPHGPFEPADEPLICGKGHSNIDPLPFEDPATGRCYLYWGSGYDPIRVRELAPDRRRFSRGSRTIDLIAPLPKDEQSHGYENQLEAAAVVARNGWYYLFYSGDDCCGETPHYAVMVARSKSPTGPFERMPDRHDGHGNVILEANDRWDAPGHCCILSEPPGDDWLFYHAIDRRDRERVVKGTTRLCRPMLMDRLRWEDDWPKIGSGTPSQYACPAPVLGGASEAVT